MRDAGMEDKPKSDYELLVISDQKASSGMLTLRADLATPAAPPPEWLFPERAFTDLGKSL